MGLFRRLLSAIQSDGTSRPDCSRGIAINPPLPPDHPFWHLKSGDKVHNVFSGMDVWVERDGRRLEWDELRPSDRR